MRKLLKRLLACMLSVILICSILNPSLTVQAVASIAYIQDFESTDIGNLPAGWTTTIPAGSSTTAGAADSGTDSKTLRLNQPTALSASSAVNFSLAGSATRGVLKYRINADSTGGVFILPTFSTANGTSKFATLAFNEGYIQKFTNSSNWTKIQPFLANRWYTIELVVDASTTVPTYDLYVDGKLVVSGEPVTTTNTSFSAVTMSIYKTTVNGYRLDDIQVSDFVDATAASFAQQQYEVEQGAAIQLSLSFTPADASDRRAVWVSSDPSVATVDTLGNVTGVGEGTATITATPEAAGLSPVSTTVVVPRVLPDSIAYTQDFESAEIGALPLGWTTTATTGSSVAIGVADDGASAKTLRVDQWASLESSAAVNFPLSSSATRGVLKYRVKADNTSGSLVLPAFSNVSGTSRFATLSLSSGYLQKLSNSSDWVNIQSFRANCWYSMELVVDDNSGTMTYDLYVDGKRVVSGEPVTTTNTSFSAVNMSIYKTTVNGYNLDDIVVSDFVDATGASLAEQYDVAMGATVQLPLSFTPADASDRKAVWVSSDPAVATVDTLGNVTGISEGTTTITATPQAIGLSSVSTTVVVSHIVPDNIQLEQSSFEMPVGSYQQINAAVKPDNVVNKTVQYVSRNTAVATVDEYGEVCAVSEGSTIIDVISTVQPLVTAQVQIEVISRTVMQSIYVSPAGNDSNDGSSQANAVRTLTRAQELVRTMNSDMTGDIYVELSEGYYTQTQTLAFDERDSGTNGYFVVYRHEGDGRATIGSARHFTGWTLYDANKNIYIADAPGITSGQLFADGVRGVRARSNGGLTSAVKNSDGYLSGDTSFLNFAHPEDLQLIYQEQWTNPRANVSSVSDAGNGQIQITMDQPGWQYVTNKGQTSATYPIYYENALELLDQPGEWYLDTHAGKLYYSPRFWESMSTVDIAMPVLTNLVNVEGSDVDHRIRNLNFEGITFADTAWTFPDTEISYPDAQGGLIRRPNSEDALIPAAVTVKYANTVNFTGNTFTRLGSTALGMPAGVQNSFVTGNLFYDLSGGAVYMGGPDITDPDNTNPEDLRLLMKNDDILNNYIHDTGVDYQSSCGIMVFFVADEDIMHNEIFNTPYSAISLGKGLDVVFTNVLRNMHVEYNFIHDIMGAGLYDGGAIYTFGNSGGSQGNYNLVANNYIRNQMNVYGTLYADAGSTFWDFESNVIDLTESPLWHGDLEPAWMMANPIRYPPVGCPNLFNGNYSTTENIRCSATPDTCTITNTHVYPDADWPQEALDIIAQAGLESGYSALKATCPGRLSLEDGEEPVSMDIGESRQLSLRVTDGQNSPVDSSSLTVRYRSTDESVATVSANGTVTGIAKGTATVQISVLSEGLLKTFQKQIFVGDTLIQIGLEGFDGTITTDTLSNGITLLPYGLTDLGRRVGISDITYTTSSSSIAVVENGVLRPMNPGNCILTITARETGRSGGPLVSQEIPVTIENEHFFVPANVPAWFQTANQSLWNNNGSTFVFSDGSITTGALNGYSYYTGQEYQNELLTFDLGIDTSTGGSSWPSIMLRSQDSLHYVAGGDTSGYLVMFTSAGIQLQRFNGSNRTVLYGNHQGADGIFGPPVTSPAFDFGGMNTIEVGALTNGNGVRLVLKVNGQTAFDCLDSSSDAISSAGYFGIIGRGETFTLQMAQIQTADTTALQQALEDAQVIQQNGYSADSWNALQQAISQARIILRNIDATQQEVDASLAGINAAIDGLTINKKNKNLKHPIKKKNKC